MKQLLTLFTFLFLITSCQDNEDANSETCSEEVFCTLEFRSIVVTIKDKDEQPVQLDSYKVIRLDENKEIAVDPNYGNSHTGTYVIATDGTFTVNETIELQFIGFVNNQEVVRENYTVNEGCCHISLVSGDVDIKLPNSITSCGTKVIVDAGTFDTAPSDHIVINNVEINGDCLTINYSASGCSGSSWELKLVDSEMLTKSIPAQRSLRLSLKDNEACEAFITKEISFDITDLQLQGSSEVVLKIKDYSENISYTY